jgi:hypothetical protein
MEPEQGKFRGQNVETGCGGFARCPAHKPWQPHAALSQAKSEHFRRLVGRITDRTFNNNIVKSGWAAAANDG